MDGQISSAIDAGNMYMIKKQEKNMVNKMPSWAYQHNKDIQKRWCRVHPTAFWGINPRTGEYYKRCAHGNADNEDCEPGNK